MYSYATDHGLKLCMADIRCGTHHLPDVRYCTLGNFAVCMFHGYQLCVDFLIFY